MRKKMLILLVLVAAALHAQAEDSILVKIKQNKDIGYSELLMTSKDQVTFIDPTYKSYPLDFKQNRSITEENFCRLIGLYFVTSETGLSKQEILFQTNESDFEVVSIKDSKFKKINVHVHMSDNFVGQIVCQKTQPQY